MVGHKLGEFADADLPPIGIRQEGNEAPPEGSVVKKRSLADNR
jgi:hypothetical protein